VPRFSRRGAAGEEVVPLMSEEASEMSMGVARVVAPSARKRRGVSCISMGMDGSGVWDSGYVSWGKFGWNKERMKVWLSVGVKSELIADQTV